MQVFSRRSDCTSGTTPASAFMRNFFFLVSCHASTVVVTHDRCKVEGYMHVDPQNLALSQTDEMVRHGLDVGLCMVPTALYVLN